VSFLQSEHYIPLNFQRMKNLLWLCLSCFILSCGNDQGMGKPPASGLPGDLFLFMDSTQWKGQLGAVIDSAFNAPMPGLPRNEGIFHLKWIDPRKLNFVLKQNRNLIFAMTLDKNSEGAEIVKRLFTKESIQKIKKEPGIYELTRKDIFAHGQEVMFLFGQTEKDLIKKIRENTQKLVDYFEFTERERLTHSLFKAGQQKRINAMLAKDFSCEIKIPFGYQLADNNHEFLWARQINPYDDKDVFIARKNYLSEKQFSKDSILQMRKDFCKKYLFEDPEKPYSYLVTETENAPIETKPVNFNGKHAIEMRGLWKTNNLTMGGPFLSYTFVDEGTNMLYYIEGFTYSPSKKQREIMRELEVILRTFKTSKELAGEKKQ
jgi:hypothetical protein